MISHHPIYSHNHYNRYINILYFVLIKYRFLYELNNRTIIKNLAIYA
jgi:hypothetical protein